MTVLLEYIPLLNFFALLYVLLQSRNWTGPAIHNETEAVRKEVSILKANYERIINDLNYYIRTNGDTTEMLTAEIKAINSRLEQLNQFHTRISSMEDNCLLHENAKHALEAFNLIKKEEK